MQYLLHLRDDLCGQMLDIASVEGLESLDRQMYGLKNSLSILSRDCLDWNCLLDWQLNCLNNVSLPYGYCLSSGGELTQRDVSDTGYENCLLCRLLCLLSVLLSDNCLVGRGEQLIARQLNGLLSAWNEDGFLAIDLELLRLQNAVDACVGRGRAREYLSGIGQGSGRLVGH